MCGLLLPSQTLMQEKTSGPLLPGERLAFYEHEGPTDCMDASEGRYSGLVCSYINVTSVQFSRSVVSDSL